MFDNIKRIFYKNKKSVIDEPESISIIAGTNLHWIVRNGMLMFFIIFITIISFSYFFKYPESVTSTVIITKDNPPSAITAKTTGRIIKIINTDSIVNESEIIAVIESPANYQHILELKELLSNFEIKQLESISFPENFELGLVQSYYSIFIKALSDYKKFIFLNYHEQKIQYLQSEYNEQNILFSQLLEQSTLLNDELNLERNQYRRDSLLFSTSVISMSDFEKSKKSWLEANYKFENAKNQLRQVSLEKLGIKQSILEMHASKEELANTKKFTLIESLVNLKSQLAQWEETYLLKSPVKGKLYINKIWSKNQYIKTGDIAFYVMPLSDSHLIGKILLPIESSGKVTQGCKVKIKLDNFPYMEYGLIDAVVKSISVVPEDNYYVAIVSLPNGLVTNYGKKLPMNKELHGIAEVRVNTIRLLFKLIFPFKSMYNNNIK